MVEFPSNGDVGSGYLATADGGGPGLIVIQEWWGLVPHIVDICDRFAAEGFCALAPDLFRGESATEPDEAGKLMMALNLDRAAKDMGGAVDYLLGHDAVRGDRVGVTGFCMGGGLALVLAAQRPDAIGAAVPFYGLIPWEDAQPDWSAIEAPVQGHYAEHDAFFTPEAARELVQQLTDLGKSVEIIIHPEVDHAFLNDTRPEVHHEERSQEAWDTAVAFLRTHLG